MMRKARRLTSGDRIALVAPASSFERDALTQGAAEIGRLGFEPVFSEAVFERALFTAGRAPQSSVAPGRIRPWPH
jgi:muramoyltetrapeptide carboxypeptidase LdcA involved in peptidoglycan recycling